MTRHKQIVRQWKVLLALDACRHGLTFDDLHSRVGREADVTVRTLRRDIDALTCAGFPIDVRTRGGSIGQTLVVLDRSEWRGAGVVFDQPAAAQ